MLTSFSWGIGNYCKFYCRWLDKYPVFCYSVICELSHWEKLCKLCNLSKDNYGLPTDQTLLTFSLNWTHNFCICYWPPDFIFSSVILDIVMYWAWQLVLQGTFTYYVIFCDLWILCPLGTGNFNKLWPQLEATVTYISCGHWPKRTSADTGNKITSVTTRKWLCNILTVRKMWSRSIILR